MIKGIHHTSYTVSEMERSLAFYRDGLGFAIQSDREVAGAFPSTLTGMDGVRLRVVHLRAYGQGLELIQYFAPPGAPTAPRTCDVGSSHLCFVVDDIDAVIQKLESVGARLLSAPQTVDGGPNAGNRCVYFLDPDGIPVELTQPVVAAQEGDGP